MILPDKLRLTVWWIILWCRILTISKLNWILLFFSQHQYIVNVQYTCTCIRHPIRITSIKTFWQYIWMFRNYQYFISLPEFYIIYTLSENEDFIYLLNLGGLRVIMKIRKWILYIEQKDFFLREIKLFISVITIDLDCDYNQHFIRSGNGNNDSNTLYYHVCNNDTELINVIRCKVFLDV